MSEVEIYETLEKIRGSLRNIEWMLCIAFVLWLFFG